MKKALLGIVAREIRMKRTKIFALALIILACLFNAQFAIAQFNMGQVLHNAAQTFSNAGVNVSQSIGSGAEELSQQFRAGGSPSIADMSGSRNENSRRRERSADGINHLPGSPAHNPGTMAERMDRQPRSSRQPQIRGEGHNPTRARERSVERNAHIVERRQEAEEDRRLETYRFNEEQRLAAQQKPPVANWVPGMGPLKGNPMASTAEELEAECKAKNESHAKMARDDRLANGSQFVFSSPILGFTLGMYEDEFVNTYLGGEYFKVVKEESGMSDTMRAQMNTPDMRKWELRPSFQEGLYHRPGEIFLSTVKCRVYSIPHPDEKVRILLRQSRNSVGPEPVKLYFLKGQLVALTIVWKDDETSKKVEDQLRQKYQMAASENEQPRGQDTIYRSFQTDDSKVFSTLPDMGTRGGYMFANVGLAEEYAKQEKERIRKLMQESENKRNAEIESLF